MARLTAIVILLLISHAMSASASPSCAKDAIARAKPLLELHFGQDERMAIDPRVKEIPGMRNPVDPTQRFKVFEVWGYIYKGRYRMRFIYYSSQGSDCVLMGQEILEYARL